MTEDTTETITWDVNREWFRNRGSSFHWHHKEVAASIHFSEVDGRHFDILIDDVVVGRSEGDNVREAKNLALVIYESTREAG